MRKPAFAFSKTKAQISRAVLISTWATSKKMKQKCDIGGQISNQIDHYKFSIF